MHQYGGYQVKEGGYGRHKDVPGCCCHAPQEAPCHHLPVKHTHCRLTLHTTPYGQQPYMHQCGGYEVAMRSKKVVMASMTMSLCAAAAHHRRFLVTACLQTQSVASLFALFTLLYLNKKQDEDAFDAVASHYRWLLVLRLVTQSGT